MTNYTVKDADYLDLWKHFEERADSLKEGMFQRVTWVLAFAAAMLGFVLTNFVTFEASTIVLKYPRLAVPCCLLGIGLCLYAFFLLKEFAQHIRRNWNRSNYCQKRVEGLIEVINSTMPGESKIKLQIWHQIGLVVVVFTLVFIVMTVTFAIL